MLFQYICVIVSLILLIGMCIFVLIDSTTKNKWMYDSGYKIFISVILVILLYVGYILFSKCPISSMLNKENYIYQDCIVTSDEGYKKLQENYNIVKQKNDNRYIVQSK